MFDCIEQFKKCADIATESISNAENLKSAHIHIYINSDSVPELECDITELVDVGTGLRKNRG